jgi:hypothetical protein
MSRLLSVANIGRDRIVRSSDELHQVLSSVDGRGGGEFWLASPGQEFPCLAIRTSAGQADVQYFQAEGHPGFRRQSGSLNPNDSVFQFEGCDPYAGELVPGEFVVSLAEALAIAEHFMQHGGMCDPSKWSEL